VPVNNNILEVDFEESIIDDRFKIKKGVSYPKFYPSLEWNKREHVLGMRFDHLEHVRDVQGGRCVGAYSKKKVQNKFFDDADNVTGLSDKGKSKIPNSKPGPKPKSKNGKTIKTKTVTFKKPILTRSMKDGEEGLIEHYGRLFDYRQAILDTNTGSTCRLDMAETDADNTYFKRFYVCFKGVKDGWLERCMKIIGLDRCFLKHTCRGELLTTIGRAVNNHMYPIDLVVVKVENQDN
nr:hypothetical protein CTI12_AA176900 [Tanacetum cinerariifolium]